MKDEQLTQDGYKKILKTENCPFKNCKFSTVNNHIHCIRENCNYILHSSSQLISHKRKHERQDLEPSKKNIISEGLLEINKISLNTTSSTPVTTLPSRTSQFLSRKRGRPTKKIVSLSCLSFFKIVLSIIIHYFSYLRIVRKIR